MVRIGLVAVILSAATFASDFEDSVQISNCRSWRYSQPAGGYVCTFQSGLVNVPTDAEFDRLVTAVNNQAKTIAGLEARVAKLENP